MPNSIEAVVILLLLHLGHTVGSESFELTVFTPVWNNTFGIMLRSGLRVPSIERSYVTGIKLIEGQERVHHVTLNGCEVLAYFVPEEYEDYKAGNITLTSSSFWKGATEDVSNFPIGNKKAIYRYPILFDTAFLNKFGEGLGFEVGDRIGANYLVLQVHAKVDNRVGRVGVKITMESNVNYLAGSSSLFPLWFLLSPRQEYTATCASRVRANRPFNLIGYIFHAHRLAQMGYLYKVTRGHWQLIVKGKPGLNRFKKLSPETRVIVADGDILYFRCELVNPTNETIKQDMQTRGDDCVVQVYYAVANEEPFGEIKGTHCLDHTEERKVMEEAGFPFLD